MSFTVTQVQYILQITFQIILAFYSPVALKLRDFVAHPAASLLQRPQRHQLPRLSCNQDNREISGKSQDSEGSADAAAAI